jgi:ubiquinone/menaquinone biosynthesis C-methylase UbiE
MENKEYFDTVAGKWDQMRQEFFSDKVREFALKIANVQPDRVAADLGAGTGFLTEELLRRGLNVIAVDHSPEMIRYMENKFRESDKLDLRQGEALNLPLDDETVDYAFANMYLHHIESPSKAIIKMARILKPGGVIVITDLDEHNHEFLRTEQFDRWLGFKREDIKQWFIKAGLKNVEVVSVGQNCCTKSDYDAKGASISIFAAMGHK